MYIFATRFGMSMRKGSVYIIWAAYFIAAAVCQAVWGDFPSAFFEFPVNAAVLLLWAVSAWLLYREGWLDIEDAMTRAKPSERVDYGEARRVKMPLLRKAARAFLSKKNAAFERFRKDEGWWVEDYALFQALADKYNDSRWFLVWPEDLRNREAGAIAEARKELKDEIDIYIALQFFSLNIIMGFCVSLPVAVMLKSKYKRKF